MKAVSVSRYGGPEVLEIVDVDTPSPGAGQVLVDVAFAGVNFMDIYARSGVGQYAETPPFVLGGEGSGRVLAVGDGVSGFAPDSGWCGRRHAAATRSWLPPPLRSWCPFPTRSRTRRPRRSSSRA